MNAELAAIWPNIKVRKDAPADAGRRLLACQRRAVGPVTFRSAVAARFAFAYQLNLEDSRLGSAYRAN